MSRKGPSDERAVLGRRLVLARLAETWERVWPELWPAVGVAALFLALSLFGFWAWLPGWLHAIGLLGFAALFVFALWCGRFAFRPATQEDGLRRMERVGGLTHRPLRGLADAMAVGRGDRAGETLWRAHRDRLLARLRDARVGFPRSDLPRRDPRALRAAVGLGVLVAAVTAGSDGWPRLKAAFAPSFGRAEAAPPADTVVWVTPPEYTGLPPVVLPAGAVGDAEPPLHGIPEGSRVLAQVHHAGLDAEQLVLRLGTDELGFTATGEASAQAELVVDESGRLEIAGPQRSLAAWTVQVIGDDNPIVRFAEPPSESQRSSLRVTFAAEDDYGVEAVTLLLAAKDGGDLPERFELNAPRQRQTEVGGANYLDLTAHPLAGLPVVLRLEALDAIGQIGLSEPFETILPERAFDNPVARRLAELRRQLASDPESREQVAEELERLSETPLAQEQDAATQLALRSAINRLTRADEPESLEEAMELMWDTALHLEDGSVSLAEQRLRDLEQALQEALEAGAGDEELQQLLDELQQALNEFLDALAQQAMQLPQDMPLQPIDPNAQILTQQDLAQMLDQIRDLLQTGAREAAEQMLSDLRRMLENMRPMQAMPQGQPSTLSELQDLIKQQQQLLDQSFDMSRQQQSGEMSGEQGQEMSEQAAGAQEALRKALGEMMRQLGEAGMDIPRALGEAEMAMRDAEGALQQGQPGSAVDPQSQALDALRQGGQAMMEAMAQQFGQGFAGGPGRPPGMPDPTARDPLGRSPRNEGGLDPYGTYVPDELDMGRARAILEELYRRAGDRNRAPVELDYIDRLLQRF